MAYIVGREYEKAYIDNSADINNKTLDTMLEKAEKAEKAEKEVLQNQTTLAATLKEEGISDPTQYNYKVNEAILQQETVFKERYGNNKIKQRGLLSWIELLYTIMHCR